VAYRESSWHGWRCIIAGLLDWFGGAAKGAVNAVRDVFDANTAEDQRKRLAAGQARYYQQQQAQKPNAYNKVARVVAPVVNNPVTRYNPINPMSSMNFLNDMSKMKVPGLGVSGQQIAQQIPTATKDVGMAIGKGSYDFVKGATKGTQKVLNTAQLPFAKAKIEADYRAGRLTRQQMLDRYQAEYDQAGLKPIVVQGPNGFRISSEIEEGTATPLEFAKQVGTVGTEAGLEIAPMVSGVALAPTKAGLQATAQQLIAKGVNPTAGAVRAAVARKIVTEGAKETALFGTANAGKVVMQKGGDVTAGDIANEYKNAAVNELMGIGLGNVVSMRGWGGKRIGEQVANATAKLRPPGPVRIANDVPVTPGPAGVPIRRTQQELAAELAASQARAVDPAVQARRGTINPPKAPRVNIHPDDQAIIRDLNDYVAGTYNPGTVGARRLETDAAMIAEKYGLPVTRTTEELAEALDGLNANAKNSIFYKKPGKSVNQNAPKPSKQDPLEALKAEARKYKSADEFVGSRANWYHGSNTPVDKLDFGRTASKGNELPYGVHFTQDKQIAGDFATGTTKGKPMAGGGVNAAELNIKNPLDVSTAGIYRQGTKEFDVLSQIAEKSGKKPTYLNIDERGRALATAKPNTIPALDPKQVLNTANPSVIKQVLKQNGYDQAIKYKMLGTADPLGMGAPVRTDAIAVLDKNLVKSDKQLTDLYNQATKAPKRIADDVGEDILPKASKMPTVPSKVAKAPAPPMAAAKAPVTEQITPGEIKISSAIENNKPSVKARTQEVREQLVSRFAPVEDLVSKIEKQSGVQLRPSKNPLSYVRQYLGGGGIANAKIDNELTPIIKQTKEFDGLREYLVAKRMNELADRGMSKRADNVLEGINAKYGAEVGNFEKVAKELYAYQNRQLDELVDVGVLTREAADNIRAKNQYYVPFNRVMPELESFAGTTPANAIGRNGNPIKAIHGSDKDIIDPIESMIRNTYDIQATVQKQKVMRSLYELAPDEFRIPAKDSMNKNRVGMFLDGKKTMLETSEPLARALNSMAEEQMNYAVKLMSVPAKMLRSGATSLNVAFALPNIVRDQLSAAVNSKYGGIPIYDFISGLSSVIGKDDSYKKWIMSGADQASFFAQDRTTLQRGVKDITGGAAYKVGKYAKSPLELFRILGEFSEKGSRVGVYKRALKGASKEFGNLEDATLAAAKESREATIDFARRGSKMKAANSLIPFLNARLQGTLKLTNSFKERPVQTGAIGMAIAGLPAAALYIHNSEYPEYAEIPDYIKRENFIIMTGNKETPFIKIPKGEVGKIFGNPVESFLAQAKSDDPNWKSTATSIVDAFLPVGSVEDPGKFVTDLMPTAASVPLQMTANFDTFRGMPIVSNWQKDLPPEQQFTSYNTETGKKIGAALGISPAMLEFGIGGLTGGLGRQALQMADAATGNKIPTQDLPVVSRFAGEQKDLNKSANEVYDQIDKDKRETARANYNIKQALKKGDTSGLEGLDKTTANRIKRSVKEEEIKKSLNPTEKALWQMSKEDLENYSGRYSKEASKVLGLKDSLSSSKSSSTKLSPKDQYKEALDKYNEEKKSGGISDVQDITRSRELTRLKAQADSSRDAVDLYGRSFTDIRNFVTSNQNGQKLWDEVLALDKKMTDAGYTSKIYDKYGRLKKVKGSGKTASKGRKGRKAKAPKRAGGGFDLLTASVKTRNVASSRGVRPVARLRGPRYSVKALPKIKKAKAVA